MENFNWKSLKRRKKIVLQLIFRKKLNDGTPYSRTSIGFEVEKKYPSWRDGLDFGTHNEDS